MQGSPINNPLWMKCLEKTVFPTPDCPIKSREAGGGVPSTSLDEPGKTSMDFISQLILKPRCFRLKPPVSLKKDDQVV